MIGSSVVALISLSLQLTQSTGCPPVANLLPTLSMTDFTSCQKWAGEENSMVDLACSEFKSFFDFTCNINRDSITGLISTNKSPESGRISTYCLRQSDKVRAGRRNFLMSFILA